MARRFIGRAIFLRHGQTEYTGVFPDLNEEGRKTIETSTRSIQELVRDAEKVMLVSSSKPRAFGSATIIRDLLGSNRCELTVNPDVSGVDFTDEERARAVFAEYLSRGGVAAVDLSYTYDPRYEDGSVFEPRSVVRRRFTRYLTSLAREMRGSPIAPHVVCVSHYECLYHFIQELFGLDYTSDQTLAHGEIIDILLYDTGDTEVAHMDVSFRGKTRTVGLHLSTGTLQPLS